MKKVDLLNRIVRLERRISVLESTKCHCYHYNWVYNPTPYPISPFRPYWGTSTGDGVNLGVTEGLTSISWSNDTLDQKNANYTLKLA